MAKRIKEIWKVVDECPLYSVSNKGRIMNNQRQTIKKVSTDRDGYKVVLLHNNGQHMNRRVHRLVAKAFIPNPLAKPEVNHKNCKKWDNSVINLEWVTGAENIVHAIKHGKIKMKPETLMSEHCRKHRGTKIKILETGETFNSVKECAESISGSANKIFECLNPNARRHTHRGYHFERID